MKTIKDPEEPGTLEELEMISEDFVTVSSMFTLICNSLIGDNDSGLP